MKLFFHSLSTLSLSLALLTGCAMAKPVVVENETQMGGVNAHNSGMIRVGDYYYWFGSDRSDKDGSFIAFNMYRSSDLKNWTFRNQIFTAQSDPDLTKGKVQGGRPKIVWNDKTQRFVMWFKWSDSKLSHLAGVAQCETIDGKYTFVRKFRPDDNRTADCTLFQDDDGTAYYIANGKGNTPQNMNIYKLTPDYLNVEKTVAVLPWKREAPAMFKRNGVYFLVTSGRSGWKPNQQKYVTATNLAGPWSDLKDFGDAKGYEGQTTYVQPVSGGQTTSYLWMSDVWRQPEGGTHNSSDYKWLPLSFPADETMEMKDAKQIIVDVKTGVVAPAK